MEPEGQIAVELLCCLASTVGLGSTFTKLRSITSLVRYTFEDNYNYKNTTVRLEVRAG